MDFPPSQLGDNFNTEDEKRITEREEKIKNLKTSYINCKIPLEEEFLFFIL